MKIGEIVYSELVKPLGLTQADCARCLHVSPQKINYFFSGRTDLTLDMASRLEKFFNIPVEFWYQLKRDLDSPNLDQDNISEVRCFPFDMSEIKIKENFIQRYTQKPKQL